MFNLEFLTESICMGAKFFIMEISVSQPPGRGPVPGPGINYTGLRET